MSSTIECQLATHFSCTCPKCFGGIEFSALPSTSSYKYENCLSQTTSIEDDLYQLQFTTTISSAPLSATSVCGEEVEQQQQEHLETSSNHSVHLHEEKFSSNSSSAAEDDHKEPSQSAPKAKKLSRRQRRQQHQKSFLDVAKSLRDSPKLFKNKPAHIELSCTLYSDQAKQYLLEKINDRYREERRRFKRLRRRQYLPSWALNENDYSQRSIRELCCVFVGGEEEYKVIDKRSIFSSVRLPRSTAIAHRNKNRWIVRNRIFNVKKPFINTFDWSDETNLNKHDTRGVVQRERDEKFNGKDGRESHNRNGGYCRRSYRNNCYHQQPQVYMGNSRKSIFGKPWLYNRQKRIYKGKDRIHDFLGF